MGEGGCCDGWGGGWGVGEVGRGGAWEMRGEFRLGFRFMASRPGGKLKAWRGSDFRLHLREEWT